MRREEIKKILEEKFKGLAIADDPANEEGLIVQKESLLDIGRFLAGHIDLAFGSLNFVTAIDRADSMEVVYMLSSMPARHRIMLKVQLPRDNPEVDSVSAIWPTAIWHEREAYDLFGVKFKGHPDLRRIMMPDDWKGHPMRKDYVHENLIPKPDVE